MQSPLKRIDAFRLWEEIARLAREIHFADARTKDHAVISTEYGLRLYRIYQAVFELSAADNDVEKLRHGLKVYDDTWTDYRRLPELSPQCASLYQERGTPWGSETEGIEKLIPRLREKLSAAASTH